jgi:hypothetical protein
MSTIPEIIVECRILEKACTASFCKNGSELHANIAEAARELADLLELHVDVVPELYKNKPRVEVG